MTNKKRLLFISAHFSTGGMPQVALKKIENLIDHYDIMVIEYADITAGLFTVQKNKIKSLLKPNKFITLGNNKKELISIIENFKPNYIHLEEVPETFMDFDVAKRIYKKDRDYFITETTHNVLFDVSSKKFFPDKFMHVSKYIADKFSILNIPYEVVEYPVEKKERPDRTEALKKLGLDPEYKHVLNVGLFTPGKNQKEIIEIARLMQDEKIQFHFVGNQAGNFQSYWEPLMQTLPKNCKVWGERTDVDNFYSCMDLFLFTSTYELNPIVLKEALSYDMKILMYNLEPYAGTYDNNKNVRFLTNDIQTNVNKIKNILFPELAEKIKLPKKCYITHTTKNYAETTFGLIYSLLEFSKYPIVIYTINFNINELKNPFKYKDNVIFVEIDDDYYPKDTTWVEKEYGKYVNRNHQETYKLLSVKADALLRAFDGGVEEGVYLDSDTVCRPNVDDLMNYTEQVIDYPLLSRGVYDIMLDEYGNRDIERPLMDYLGVKERSMFYVQSNIVVFTKQCSSFIKKWKDAGRDITILTNFKKWAPFQDETVVNVLLWKYKYTKHLPMHHFNIRNPRFVEEFEKFDISDKSKYADHMKGFPFYIDGVQMEWSYIPLNKDDIKVFHGLKKLDEMLEIIEYENRVKNENDNDCKIDILQIGSHTGNTINDPIFAKVDESTKLILIEPVPYLFNQLQDNYKNKMSDLSNIIFINKAVSDFIGEIELTIPSEKNDFSKFPFWASQLASVNHNHATAHLPNIIVDKIKVKTTTIDEIINEYNIKEINLLHTDTEGHDYTILMNYSFKIRPRKILFEHKHIDGIFTVGNKYEELTNKLKSLGYKKIYQNDEDTMFEL